jgi:hypothetical protein
VASHPLAARDLLADVNRLSAVGEMIARQHEPVGLVGEWLAPVTGEDRLALGGQLLRVCGEFDRLVRARTVVPGRDCSHDGAAEEFEPALVERLHAWPAAVAADVSCPAA